MSYSVYLLTCKKTKKKYVGSSFDVEHRMKIHEITRGCYSRDIIEEGDYDLDILETDIPDRITALWRERYYFDTIEGLVNKNRPIITEDEMKESKRASASKNYYDRHEYFLKQKADYQKANKEVIQQKRAEKITCDCGCILSRSSLTGHKKRPKHFQLLEVV